MEVIKWADDTGQKIILSGGEAEELMEALRRALRDYSDEGHYGRFEIKVER